jgi:hypothetical protein
MTEDVFSFRAFTRLKQLTHLLATRQIDADFFWPSVELASGKEKLS